MKKIIIFVLILVAAGGFGVWLMRRETPPAHEEMSTVIESPAVIIIRMSAEGFEPKNVTISLGDTVRFVNENTVRHWPASAIHPTHEIYPAFDPKMPIESGSEWAFTFDHKGIWRFHDHLYPTMTGSVIVE